MPRTPEERTLLQRLEDDPALAEALGDRMEEERKRNTPAEMGQTADAWQRVLKSFRKRSLTGTFAFTHGEHDQASAEAAENLLFFPSQEDSASRLAANSLTTGSAVRCAPEDVEALATALETGTVTARPVPFRIDPEAEGHFCLFCGRDTLYRFDGQRFMTAPCALPQAPCLVEFDCTGAVVIDDHFRHLVDDWYEQQKAALKQAVGDTERDWSRLARQALARMYAEHGIVYLKAGSMPHLYRVGGETDRHLIASPGYDRNEEHPSERGQPVHPDGERLSALLSDANTTLIMDLATFKARGGELRSDRRAFPLVKGRYRVRLLSTERGFNPHTGPGDATTPTIFASFERIG